jgi:hypothetical protein
MEKNIFSMGGFIQGRKVGAGGGKATGWEGEWAVFSYICFPVNLTFP